MSRQTRSIVGLIVALAGLAVSATGMFAVQGTIAFVGIVIWAVGYTLMLS